METEATRSVARPGDFWGPEGHKQQRVHGEVGGQGACPFLGWSWGPLCDNKSARWAAGLCQTGCTWQVPPVGLQLHPLQPHWGLRPQRSVEGRPHSQREQ